jgi:hypothetical protein
MIQPNIYCKVSGMAMQCIADWSKANGGKLPNVLEIGCADGQGTMRYAGFCNAVLCIDPMVSDRPDIDSREPFCYEPDSTKVEIFKRRVIGFNNTSLIIGCSLWPGTIAMAKSALGGRSVDVLIIDGCHHPFEAVWGDFETYYSLVSKGGFVIFDDLYEDCILQAYELAALSKSMRKHDRWSSPAPLLQDVGSLEKTEERAP